ncbi:MAG: hypothetical protein LBD27_02065 [Tannerella sp.]|nr:hypothetical protein [Tannerella sp.]
MFAVIILAGCVVLMSIRVMLRRDGRFPDTHIGNNRALKERGIFCARTQDEEDAGKQRLYERLDKIK